jgi:uncharacterized membrane protein
MKDILPMPTLLREISQHKYKLIILVLLLAASAISATLAKARMVYSNTNDYAFLLWNLVLAWIPLVFASAAYTVSWTRKFLFLIIPICALVWLVFFPNAPYLLTDFQHLSQIKGNAPLWFDVILLIWFAWTGLLLGVFSLYLMQEIVARAFGPLISWIFAITVTALSSIGIYLGRFLRWNSWDILGNPLPIVHDIYEWLRYPFSNLRTWGFTTLFTLFFLFIYLTFYTFGHVIQEQKK